MIKYIKKKLYFTIAAYFRFFARIRLGVWKPRVIVITGSSGKTTTLHLIESQVKTAARYSYHANSAFGIPFDILGLERRSLMPREWFYLFLAAPFKAFKKPYEQKLYIVEADCDRPGEGKFLASLLKPETAIWMSSGATHGMNFEKLVAEKKFSSIEEAVAYEFGFFLEYSSGSAIVNGDNEFIMSQLHRTNAPVEIIRSDERLKEYKILSEGTVFAIDGALYRFNCLLPREVFYSIAATVDLISRLGMKFDPSFKNLSLPPGRSSIFRGIKDTMIIDSSYNATFDGMAAIVRMFARYPAKIKWAVLGDMLEQGTREKEEHEKLAELIAAAGLSKIILVGPRISRHTYPKIMPLLKNPAVVEKFEFPRQALDYIKNTAGGGEAILFKGARFLEGVIEHLLRDKGDVKNLCRRERKWQIRRKEWGL